MNKSYLTNFIAFVFILLSFAFESPYKESFLYAGIFALLGALTNLLAIHMLFHRVPLLYGSGVIELNFESFKNSIKELIMREFFSKEQLDNFFENEEKKIDLVPIIESTDFNPAFDAMSQSVMESSFGAMLGMFGGSSALEQLREPFVKKLQNSIVTITKSEAFNAQLAHHLKTSSLNDDIISAVEKLVDKRLNELTPKMVNEIVQNLIKKHLGWLVLWGGFFGGLIGVISSFIL